MIYVAETFQLSDEARADLPFREWLQGFSALDRSPEAEKAMFQDPHVMKECGRFAARSEALERGIMLPVE